MRGFREAVQELGYPAEELLRHGETKCVYGVTLISNTRDFLLGLSRRPRCLFSQRSAKNSTSCIVEYWWNRWVKSRLSRPKVFEQIAAESLTHPIRHSARVVLPEENPAQMSMFEDLDL